jgi:K+-sensing histidine kinase KdpD
MGLVSTSQYPGEADRSLHVSRQPLSNAQAVAVAFFATGVCTLVDQGLRFWMGEANLILTYLLGVLVVALSGHRAASILAALLAVAAFDWFFVLPTGTLAVRDARDLFTFLVMGIVALTISTQTSRLVRLLGEAQHARSQAEVERLRNSLLSAVSHDLRTPLSGIVGAASTLLEGGDELAPGIRAELARDIVGEAARLDRIVTNLLQATRLDAGPVRLEQSWFPLEEPLGAALSRLESPLTTVRVHVDLPPDLPLLHGDPVLVEQLILNLLLNAVTASPRGGTIQIQATHDGERVQVVVQDEGAGFPREILEQTDPRAWGLGGRQGRSGTGLGLLICHGVVTAHGGNIEIRNAPEGGAKVTFNLPVVTPPALPGRENILDHA